MFDWKVFVPWMLTLATLIAGIWQYADKQAQANREPFLLKQLDLVFEASQTVSVLSNSTDSAAWEKARVRFWELYWGPLGLVEDGAVERCMRQAGLIVPQPGTNPGTLPLTKLRSVSLELSHAARDLVLESWNTSLAPLASRKDRVGCPEMPRSSASR
jgi:hypothetical protein